MIISLIKLSIRIYLSLLQEFFEYAFGIKILKFFMLIVRQVIKFVKLTFISFHLVVLIYYIMYPQYISKQLVFNKNQQNNYYSYILDNSATKDICSEWKLFKNSSYQKEEALQSLEQKLRKEEQQLDFFISKRLKNKDENNTKDLLEGDTQQTNTNQESEDITLNILNHQNKIKKYKSDYEEEKNKVNNFKLQKKKQNMWYSWTDMNLVCNLNRNYDPDDSQSIKTSIKASTITLEFQILNLPSFHQSLKTIPLNVLIINKFNQKIPLKKDIIIQSEQQSKKSYFQRISRQILQKFFNFLGLEIEDDVIEIKEEIEADKKGSEIGSEISGIIISLENTTNQYLIQQSKIEIIPSLKGLQYLIFHHYYATFFLLFNGILIYLYLLTAIITWFYEMMQTNKKKMSLF